VIKIDDENCDRPNGYKME